jgi:zeta-carotene desaturase
MGCYHATRRYLKTIGAEHLAALQPNLRIDFVHPEHGVATLACPSLPSPLHALVGLLRLRSLPLFDRLKLITVGKELLFSSDEKEKRLRSLTVDEWLTSLGQTELNKKYLWEIIAIGSLNDDPKAVSALLFYRVLRAAFTGSRKDSSLLVPRVGLSELLVDPAVRYLEQRGAEIRTNCTVEEFIVEGESVMSVRCADGMIVEADAFISAVSHYAFPSLVKGATLDSALGKMQQAVGRFESSPIISLHLWLDKMIVEDEIVALLDSKVQWVFNRSKMLMRKSETPTNIKQYLTLVISGAVEYVDIEKERLVELAMHDLRLAFPRAADTDVVHALVIKEKRATFSPRPEIERYRPSADIGLRNLAMAGDWTDTGLPATIEGAVLSGRRAAEVLLSK